jgi:PPK2 family polyphosphate:nucleotide phosphotransferase
MVGHVRALRQYAPRESISMKTKQDIAGPAVVVKPGAKLLLSGIDPRATAGLVKAEAKAETERDAEAIDKLQDRLYAEGSRALLVVLQGTDTSGKDGAIRAVFNRTGPIGVVVTAFKAPSADELAHDFLWRIHRAVPAKGMIGIFNRSHYEDVLIAKVKKLAAPDVIEARYEQINRFERHLSETGTAILKFMLHISKDEQRQRFDERLHKREKQWKFNPGDLEDRKLWPDYRAAYETMLARCSTEHAPWHVIPADRNWVRNHAIGRIVRQTLERLDPQYPKPDWKPEDFVIS